MTQSEAMKELIALRNKLPYQDFIETTVQTMGGRLAGFDKARCEELLNIAYGPTSERLFK